MRIPLHSIALLAGALGLAGCLSINPADGEYGCQQTSDCPDNYYCDQPSNSCVQNGHDSLNRGDADLAAPADGDGSPGDLPTCNCPPATGACVQVTCDNGECGTRPVPGGTAVPEALETPGDCVRLICDDHGNSVPMPDPTDLPVDNSDCTIKLCSGTVPSITNKPAGTACGSGGFCNDKGQCGGCSPGATQCVITVPQTCTADGVWLNGPPCAFVCKAGSCTGVCTPTHLQCASSTPETCNSDGQWIDSTPCANVCSGGVCGGACTPNAKQCAANNTQETCDSSGKWGSDVACAYLCSGQGVCSGNCKPGDKQCAGTVTPQSCDANGNWVSGLDCPSVCTGKGMCTGVCKPTDKQCSNGTPQLCDSTGTWQSQVACPFVCTGAGMCSGSCVPTDRQCSTLTPQTCTSAGGWQNDVGGACSYVCSGKGVCSGSCVPGDKKCNGLTPQTCDSTGTFTDAATACKFVCSGKGVCSGVCAPNTPGCADASTPELCGSDGNWVVGTACVNSVCKNGQCSGSCKPGALICTGDQPQLCDSTGTYQNQGSPCPFGCTGAGVCSALVAPQPTALVDGSDVSVSWTAPSFSGVTCHVERSSDAGAHWAQPATSISPCPSQARTPCSAYDPFVLRGNYYYDVVCTGSGQTARSAPYPALSASALVPGIELCGTTYTKNSYVVDGVSPGTVKTERTVSNAQSNAGFNNSWAIASDPKAGEIWVTSNDSNVITVFTRTANDPTGLTSSRSLYVAPEGGTASLRPVGIALLGTEVIVVMRTSPYYIAGYPRNFTSTIGTPSTIAPTWWLKGAAAGVNGPLSVATDGGNLIYVGNSGAHAVTVFQRNQITAANHTVLPPNTVSLNFGIPSALAVDPVARQLFVADSSAVRIDVVSADSAAGNPVLLRTITSTGSPNSGLTLPYAIGLDGGLLYVLNLDTGIVATMSSNTSDANPTSATKLLTADFGGGAGLAICN